MNRTAFAENIVVQYEIPATSNIRGSPDLDLGPRKDAKPGSNEEFPQNTLWLGVSCGPDITNALRACARQSHNPSPRGILAR